MMKKITSLLIVVAFLLGGLTGCESAPEEDVSEEESASVEEMEEPEEEPVVEESELVKQARDVAALATSIKENPENLDALLAESGMTEEELEELLFEISEDPDASRAYAEAR